MTEERMEALEAKMDKIDKKLSFIIAKLISERRPHTQKEIEDVEEVKEEAEVILDAVQDVVKPNNEGIAAQMSEEDIDELVPEEEEEHDFDPSSTFDRTDVEEGEDDEEKN